MKNFTLPAVLLLAGMMFSCSDRSEPPTPFSESFVEVSHEDPRYFQLSNGEPYIPIGCNIAAISDVAHMEKYMLEMHLNGANFARVWLNSSLLEIETEYGVLNERNLGNIDRLLELATRYDIKVKMCIESFRHILPGKNRWDTKASYHISNGGPFEDIAGYITTEKGRQEFLRRLGILQQRYGDHPAVFGWELWNEMNAVAYPHIEEWNEYMLPQVKKMFPRNLVMQSLGSLDRKSSFPIYEYINRMPSNEVAQVHRYIDLGAELGVCGAPVDSMASDAVCFMMEYGLTKPILLAETGAVKPVHTGPHEAYEKDTVGVIFHDALFAPFFTGAAGPGHMWHWDSYIDRNGLWYHFARFASAVEGINPVAEKFDLRRADQNGLKVYALRGENTLLAWCRDTACDWITEFEKGITPKPVRGAELDLSGLTRGRQVLSAAIYDPWEDRWTDATPGGRVTLPDFTRSVVVKICY